MIDKNTFGRTEHNSTRVIFGAAALGGVTQKESDKTMELILEYGINHIDVAQSYGEAEKRLGPWLKNHRDKFFLATKTEERSYKGAMKHLEESRKKLNTDVIDLWQLHVLVDEDSWTETMSPGGALDAFIEAKDKGLVKHLGVTGHGTQAPGFHLRSLERYSFDSVLLPWNTTMANNKDYVESFTKLRDICLEKNVAFQTIKSLCRRPWPDNAERNYACWYEPLTEQKDINLVVSYILSHKQHFLNSTGDIHLLPKILKAAEDFSAGKITIPTEQVVKNQIKRLDMKPLFCS